MEEQLKRRMITFSSEVIRMVEGLSRGRTADVVGEQLIRCAASIGANYRLACKRRSKADFISKLGIAEEAADESQYWLEILSSLELVDSDTFRRLHSEAGDLTALLTSSGKTAKKRA